MKVGSSSSNHRDLQAHNISWAPPMAWRVPCSHTSSSPHHPGGHISACHHLHLEGEGAVQVKMMLPAQGLIHLWIMATGTVTHICGTCWDSL